MSETHPSREITISLHLTEEYRNNILEKGGIDHWVPIEIISDTTELFGEGGVRGIAPNIAYDLLESIDKINTSDKYVIEFEFGPAWLVIEHHDNDALALTNCTTITGVRNPDKRLDIDKTILVTKSAWKSEVMHTVQGFLRGLEDVDSEITTDPEFREIQEMLNDLEDLD